MPRISSRFPSGENAVACLRKSSAQAAVQSSPLSCWPGLQIESIRPFFVQRVSEDLPSRENLAELASHFVVSNPCQFFLLATSSNADILKDTFFLSGKLSGASCLFAGDAEAGA